MCRCPANFESEAWAESGQAPYSVPVPCCTVIFDCEGTLSLKIYILYHIFRFFVLLRVRIRQCGLALLKRLCCICRCYLFSCSFYRLIHVQVDFITFQNNNWKPFFAYIPSCQAYRVVHSSPPRRGLCGRAVAPKTLAV